MGECPPPTWRETGRTTAHGLVTSPLRGGHKTERRNVTVEHPGKRMVTKHVHLK